ncbi:MAG TPA: type II toxin-antitoxin system RelE/ParE family toxin [Planctomycetota bacterium]|nr:type II toxin-antitoxin system RelE/ParE family toxin [Planctomycetota bacterium]HRR82678.1 type II toxin-antitoxin system RelE/ParE family toxin [Planctomycetota bacterium]HRT93917.1 type II toxin-antitoxin system RelE/ParE family toxin [Planctomycetota bacterium]
MIVSFGDRATEDIYHGLSSKRTRRIPAVLWRTARRKLDMLEYAQSLRDPLALPGNRLEALKGGLSGFHSIRINDQWRILFRWHEGAAHKVTIVDYHTG